MGTQMRKTYRGLNPSMLRDEVRGLLHKQGIVAVETESSTYGLSSGATQSRITLELRTRGGHEGESQCGSVHISGSPRDETRMLLDVDAAVCPQEKLSAFQDDLDFVLGSYELKW
ncbi:MAG: hypothetical protein ACNA7X_00625 [Dehalococcoidia bacterium]